MVSAGVVSGCGAGTVSSGVYSGSADCGLRFGIPSNSCSMSLATSSVGVRLAPSSGRMTRSPRLAGRGAEDEKGAVGCGKVVCAGAACSVGCGDNAETSGRTGGICGDCGMVGACCGVAAGWAAGCGCGAGVSPGTSPKTSWTVRTTSSMPTWDFTR